ncbi:MAG: DUF397 domain-containing protein [Sporichthyaceae bacterium]|nr:DUF397 domain-containing protein [Sporichthyaceae bacterium]
MTWTRSSFCMDPNNTCVEVQQIGHSVIVRDSKNPDGPTLSFSRDEWAAFLKGAKDGEFDLPDG